MKLSINCILCLFLSLLTQASLNAGPAPTPSPTPTPKASPVMESTKSTQPTSTTEPIAPTPSSTPTLNAEITQALNSIDQAFKERANEKRAREGLELARKLYKQEPNNAEAAWRVAMFCYYHGIRLAQTDEEKKSLYDEGRKAGNLSIEKNTKCAPCHFWTAIDMALYAQTVGSLKMLFTLTDVRDHLRASIAEDPSYAWAGAYRLLGNIEEKLPGILGGNNKRAKNYYLKAIEFAPDEPMNYLYLARLLKNELDEPTEALEYAKKGATLTRPGPDRIEARDALDELIALVKTLEKK